MPLFSVCVFFPLGLFSSFFYLCLFSVVFVIYLFVFVFCLFFSCIDAEKTQRSCYLLSFLRRNLEVMEFKLDSSSGLCDMECFHVTPRRSYWCHKTMKRRPCWCLKPILQELNSFLLQTLSFVPINLHRYWPREGKRSIADSIGQKVHVTTLTLNQIELNVKNFVFSTFARFFLLSSVFIFLLLKKMTTLQDCDKFN